MTGNYQLSLRLNNWVGMAADFVLNVQVLADATILDSFLMSGVAPTAWQVGDTITVEAFRSRSSCNDLPDNLKYVWLINGSYQFLGPAFNMQASLLGAGQFPLILRLDPLLLFYNANLLIKDQDPVPIILGGSNRTISTSATLDLDGSQSILPRPSFGFVRAVSRHSAPRSTMRCSGSSLT